MWNDSSPFTLCFAKTADGPNYVAVLRCDIFIEEMGSATLSLLAFKYGIIFKSMARMRESLLIKK